MQAETVLLNNILLALGTKPQWCRIWRNQTGALPDPRTGRWIRFGLKGSADILGLLITGRFLAIEVKTEKGRLRADQVAFRNMVERFGGLYVVARSVDDAVRAVEGAVDGAGGGSEAHMLAGATAVTRNVGRAVKPVGKNPVPRPLQRRPTGREG